MDVCVTGPDEERRATVRGRGRLRGHAPLVVEAAVRLTDGARPAPGAFAPGALFDALDFLGSFPSDVLTVEVTDR